MQCKSLWIKASAKCINVNVNVNILTGGCTICVWEMLVRLKRAFERMFQAASTEFVEISKNHILYSKESLWVKSFLNKLFGA